jgi:hypothetical protein
MRRATMTMATLAMAALLAYSQPAEAKFNLGRSIGNAWFKVKEGVVKLTKSNATLTRSYQLNNGVTVKTENNYVKGEKYATKRVISGKSGNSSEYYNAPNRSWSKKSRALNNGTEVSWLKSTNKVTGAVISSKTTTGKNGGMTRVMKSETSGLTLKTKQWPTPTAVLGVQTLRGGQGALISLKRYGQALPQ